MEETEEKDQDVDEEFQAQLNEKIKKFFESKPFISSRDELDNFLSAIDLLDIFNSDEEKDPLWQSLLKNAENSKINCENAIQGVNDFLTQLEDGGQENKEQNPENDNNKETLLTRFTRISRLSIKGVNQGGNKNKLALNRYKQRAIDEYDVLDSNSLIQFKKIFTLLKMKKLNEKISLEDLKKMCEKCKFITFDINDIWRYLSFCVCEENIKSLEDKTELIINQDIFEEVQSFINQRIINEDIEYDSDDLEEDENKDKTENLDEITLEIIEKLIKKSININENNMIMNDIKNEIKKLNKGEIENYHELINEKIQQIEEFLSKNREEEEFNLKKMQTIKGNILRLADNIKLWKDDYYALYEKYNNNQERDIDEDTERLIEENMLLSQEKENKEIEIDNLLEEKKAMKIDYQNMLMQYEDAIREKNELTQEISELKMNNYKLKGDYDKLLNDIVNKMEKDKKTKKNNKNENIEIPYEEQVKELKHINNSKIDDGQKISRKKDIFNNMSNDKLINYIMEIERINQTLSNEKGSKDKKIHELTQKNIDLNNLMNVVKSRNIDLEEEAKNLKQKIDNLSNDVKNNEMFRPSIAMNSQMRISRLSKLNTEGINALKFNIAKNTGFNTKKNIGKIKLKDINTKQQNKFKNISIDLYGVKEVEDEEDQENKKGGINNKNNNINLDTNKTELNLGGDAKTKNEINISSNKGFNIDDKNNKKNKMGITDDKGFNFGNNKNSKTAFGIDSNNNMNFNNKTEIDLSSNSSGIFFNGNSNDINLSSENNLNMGITSSVVQFDINNDNNINIDGNIKNNMFETVNSSNISLDEKKKNQDYKNKIQSELYFESKPKNKNENNEDIPTLKIDNLMGDVDDNDNNNAIKENININNIKNENSISITNNKNNNENNKDNNNDNINEEDDFENIRTNTIMMTDKKDENENLENIIFTGIQNEGFNIDNSSTKQPLFSENSNNININITENDHNNNINNNFNNIDNITSINIKNEKEHKDKNDIQLDKSKQNEITMSSTSTSHKMFQDNNNTNKNITSRNNNFSLSSSNNKKIIQNNNARISNKSTDSFGKMELFPSVHLSESNGNNIQYSRLSKVELDELRNNNYDYYSLYQEDYIKKKLKEEKDNCNEFNLYSDQIFLLTDKKHLSKRYIIITPSHLYIIEPKEMKFTHVIKKEKILSFKISNKNLNLLLFQIHGGDNILIETLRRMDLLSYLRETYRNNKSLIKFKYEDKFDVKIKGKVTTVSVKDKIFSDLSNFDGAQKIGYLFMYIGTYIRVIFKEKLFVLTSIGLIMFDEPNSPPSKLYPIIGSTIQKLEGTKYGRENCFQVTLLSGKVKVFSTRKRREMESWLKEFEKINKEFQNKMKQLDTINKKLIDN